MKRKTWILSAVMYVIVAMACFGVLHLLKKMTHPQEPFETSAQESSSRPEEHGEQETETQEETQLSLIHI